MCVLEDAYKLSMVSEQYVPSLVAAAYNLLEFASMSWLFVGCYSDHFYSTVLPFMIVLLLSP